MLSRQNKTKILFAGIISRRLIIVSNVLMQIFPRQKVRMYTYNSRVELTSLTFERIT